jgi:hypothetical protein
MEENDGWVIVPFQEPMVVYGAATSSYLQMVGLVELQREKDSVCENTLLVKREC